MNIIRVNGATGNVAVKLTVHGLPLSRERMVELKDPSFLVSYYNRKKVGVRQIDLAIELVPEDGVLFLDNGAFSAWNYNLDVEAGKKDGPPIELDEEYWAAYYDWAEDILDRCPQAVAIIPDVIGGTVEENLDLIWACPLEDHRTVPVWHLNEPVEHLLKLVTLGHPRIAFGSCGEYRTPGVGAWNDRIKEVFAELDNFFAGDEDGWCEFVRPAIHMLRGNSVQHLERFDSSDSTNVCQNNNRQAKLGEDIVAFQKRVEDKAKQGLGFRNAELYGTIKDDNLSILLSDISIAHSFIEVFEDAGKTDDPRYRATVDQHRKLKRRLERSTAVDYVQHSGV